MSLTATAWAILAVTVILLTPIAWACWKYDVERMQAKQHHC